MSMNYKFTLYCVPGQLFRPGMHFFKIGEWITDPSYLILSHGIMSAAEYRHFLTQQQVPIYQGVSFAWIGLYPAHESKKFTETQFCGYLHRSQINEWKGYINVG